MPPSHAFFASLHAFLQTVPEPTVTLTFEQVEAIFGQPLPASAWHSRSYWHDFDRPPFPNRWQTLSWKLSCSMAAQTITLTRSQTLGPQKGAVST
jgi:hypothetical protein